MTVLLVCDLEDWIMGEIARNLARLLAPEMRVTLLVAERVGFARELERLQATADVIHFLSAYNFFEHHKRVGGPCVVTIAHVADDNWPLFDRHAARMDAVSAMSQEWHRRLVERLPGGLPIRHTRFGLDTDRFQRHASARSRYLERSNLDPRTLVFGFASSTWSNESDRKGLDTLWQSFSRLEEECGEPFVLRIIGRGWVTDMVPATLRARAEVEGMINAEQLPEFYSSLDYYVCTSRIEGGPYPVLEAMSCGAVVLSTPVGQVPEIICHGENGFLLSISAVVETFVAAVKRTAPDLHWRRDCGQRARHSVVSQFSWDVVARDRALVTLYERALQHHHARPAGERAWLRARARAFALAGRWLPAGPRRKLARLARQRDRASRRPSPATLNSIADEPK